MKMKFSIKDFFSKCDQIGSFLLIWSHLLKKSLIENIIIFAVLALFRYKNDIITSKTKKKIVSMNYDRLLYGNRLVTFQAKEGNLENFFFQENHCCRVLLTSFHKFHSIIFDEPRYS